MNDAAPKPDLAAAPQQSGSHRPTRLGVLAVLATWHPVLVAVFCLAPFAGLLIRDERTLPGGMSGDFAAYQLPIRAYARAEMVSGRFPLWVPYLAGGLPLHAGQQASLCHPLLMPLVLAVGAEYGLKLCLFAHFLIGFAGAFCLARYYGISRPGSSLAALLTTWSGFAVNHLIAGHITLILQYALMPWFFLALEVLLRRPGPLPATALAGLAACLAVSGHPQVFYYSLLLGSLWATGSLVAGAARRVRRRALAWGLIAATLAFLLSAIQTIPSLELARNGVSESFRSRGNFPSQHALSGLDFVRLIAPNIAGNPFTGPKGFGVGENFHERVVYLALITPLLALYGLSRARAMRWQWGAAALTVLSLAIALGDSTPAFKPLSNVVPGLGLFRCPGRVFGVASIFVALLAARGLDALVRGCARARSTRWIPIIAAIWCLANLGGWALLENKDGVGWHSYVLYARQNLVGDVIVWVPLAGATLAVLAFAWRLGAQRRGAAYVLAVLLVMLDLGWNNVRSFHLEPPPHVRLPQGLLSAGLPRRFVQAPVSASVSTNQLRYSTLVPAALEAHRQLLGTKEGGVLPASTERLFHAAAGNARVVLNVAACDYACSADGATCEPLEPPLPRLRFFSEADAAVVDVPIERIDAGDVQRMRERMHDNARTIVDEPQRLELDLDAPTAGRLVLADTWYPGWRATVDGNPVAIDRVHGVFRSVRLPPGKHRIAFVFDPLSFRIGLAGTLAGIVIWLGLLVYAIRRKACATSTTPASMFAPNCRG